jgi:two-component system, NarL family, nitrate/nitrite response regulator NarL
MNCGNRGKKKIRVLVADRVGVFTLGLKKLFAVEDDLRVVAQTHSAPQSLELAKSFQPDLLFIQAEIIQEARGRLLSDLRRLSPKCKIVVMSSSPSTEEEGLRYVRMGAAGVILKSGEASLFVECARKVIWEGGLWLPQHQVAHLDKSVVADSFQPVRPADTLTRREKTVVSYMVQGWRNQEIAQQLSITNQTVRNHLRSIYDKVGVSDRLELVLYAIHQKMALPPLQLPQGAA